MKSIQVAFSLAAAVLLSGCALVPVTPGMSRDEVLAHYGKPTRTVAVDAGTRLQYSLQPAGQSVVMVDLNASDKVISVRQVMAFNEFLRIEPGRWTREDVEREFGPPAKVDRVASWPGDIMNYRWRENIQDMLFWVYLDGANRVQRTGQGMEFPMAEIND